MVDGEDFFVVESSHFVESVRRRTNKKGGPERLARCRLLHLAIHPQQWRAFSHAPHSRRAGRRAYQPPNRQLLTHRKTARAGCAQWRAFQWPRKESRMRRRSFCRLLAAAPIACLPALAAARQTQSEGEPEGELIDIVLEISDGGRPLFAPQLQARPGRKTTDRKSVV